MTVWREFLMRDVMLEFYDGPHATPPPANEGPVYLGIKNITDSGALDLTDVRHIAEEDFDRWTRRVAPRPGDVVFTYEATLHRYALIPEGFRGCLGRRIALIRPNPDVVLPRYLHFALLGPTWRSAVTDRIISGATVDRIPISDFPNFPITLPDMRTQGIVVGILGALDDLLENTRQRIALLDELAQRTYREWFIHFRYPGHVVDAVIDTPIGSMPVGWQVRRVAEVASSERNAVAAGPFGSKLGRSDYVEAGVPVIRGVNLKVGGGFDESTFVFVAPDKADELRSSLARRGDIVITQRGTLGQVGLIPENSRFDRYVLSQSQMKVTIDPDKCVPIFFYEQFRSVETTRRFVAQAMSSGVPHVNLTLLRTFEVLNPPLPLQRRFADVAKPADNLAWNLRTQLDRLSSLRKLLLPRLISGDVNVSHVDIDDVEAWVA